MQARQENNKHQPRRLVGRQNAKICYRHSRVHARGYLRPRASKKNVNDLCYKIHPNLAASPLIMDTSAKRLSSSALQLTSLPLIVMLLYFDVSNAHSAPGSASFSNNSCPNLRLSYRRPFSKALHSSFSRSYAGTIVEFSATNTRRSSVSSIFMLDTSMSPLLIRSLINALGMWPP